MPAIPASIEYLADIDLYKKEKPWSGLLVDSKKLFDAGQRLDNIEFEYHDCEIRDVREFPDLSFETTGFQVVRQTSSTFSEFDTIDKLQAHRDEMAVFLTETLDAAFVKTYDCHTRLNTERTNTTIDVMDSTIPDSPARGAHNDITTKSGREVVMRNFTDKEKERYLRPGYRIRIVNTWRPLLPLCEDRPLAFCDASLVDSSDLIAADRVYPQAIGEIYYLKWNKSHRWFWIDQQTPEDVLVMTMYDTNPAGRARYCPHISFENSRAPSNAAPRRSVETRSIVMSQC